MRIHVGVLGLGTVGQAVVRAAASAAPLRRHGLSVSIGCALVRDAGRERRCPKVPRVTNNVEAFMRGRYDVVIDALPGVEPAAAIAGRLLGKGIPVVSANKVLVAAEGRRLRRIAERGGTSFRVEASVMAGVPFLGAFERRPFAADVSRFAGIVNGTSHFILSRIGQGASFRDALAEAQSLGYAEPNPAADISGGDAREKLTVLAEVLFGFTVAPGSLTPEGIAGISPDALASARALGGVIKPVVTAARKPRGLSAFVGPAWVPASHPLATISGRDNAIVIDSRFSGRLLFAGPGAGPDVTAATLLDDAIEAVRGKGAISIGDVKTARADAPAVIDAPDTGWFLRVTSDSAGVCAAFVRAQLRAAGITVTHDLDETGAASMLTAPVAAERITALRAAFHGHALSCSAWRALHD